jgi:hypothetical protein
MSKHRRHFAEPYHRDREAAQAWGAHVAEQVREQRQRPAQGISTPQNDRDAEPTNWR